MQSMGRRLTRRAKGAGNKRQSLRQQRGGGGATSIEDWITAVKQFRMFAKEKADEYRPNPDRPGGYGQADYSLGQYTFQDIKDASLTLPDMEVSRAVDPNFDINRYSSTPGPPTDIREAGERIAFILKSIIERNGTPADFKARIKERKKDVDMHESFVELASTEFKLRQQPLPKEESDMFVILEDDTSYPLFIWALAMNLPVTPVAMKPELVPPKGPTTLLLEDRPLNNAPRQ